jgi:gluconate kinase
MEQEMIFISKDQAKDLIRIMTRAEYYCSHAMSTSQLGPNDEPTCSYAGASGYAKATLREAIQVIETAM